MLKSIFKLHHGLIVFVMLALPFFLISDPVSALSPVATDSQIAVVDDDGDDVTSSDDDDDDSDSTSDSGKNNVQKLPEALPAPKPNNDGSIETTFFGNFRDDGTGCGVYNLLNFIIDILTFGIGIIAIIGITICGINYLTAKGSVAKTAKAKHRFVQIVIGLALYATLWALLNFLLPGGKLNTNTVCGAATSSSSHYGTQNPWTSNYPDSVYQDQTQQSTEISFDDDEDYPDVGEISTSFVKLVVADVGYTADLKAKAESGSPVSYKSSNSSIVSVDSKGKITAKKPGKAKITLTAKAKDGGTATKTVGIVVPKIRDRVGALTPWRDTLVDTFSHINGRTYSFGSPCKWWGSGDNWSGKTGKSGSTQSCLTLPVVSMKRMGLMSKSAKCFWLTSNGGTQPNSTVKKLKKNSKYLKVYYPHKSFKSLANSGKLEYGDVVVRTGHIYVYMGTKKGSHKIYQGGTTREVSPDTRVVWGHGSGGKAKPITQKIRNKIKASDNVLKKYKNNKNHFKGSDAKGSNLSAKIRIVGHIRTFTVKTVCVNGSITSSNLYMANQSVKISYKPVSGKTLSYIKVDGTKISGHNSSYTFNHLSSNHTIKVVYK